MTFVFKIKTEDIEINLEAKFRDDTLLELIFTEKDATDIPKEYLPFVKRVENYFLGKDDLSNIKIELSGTAFQIKTWEALIRIPYGKVISYKDQAKLANHESAVRAIANANGKNKISLIVP